MGSQYLVCRSHGPAPSYSPEPFDDSHVSTSEVLNSWKNDTLLPLAIFLAESQSSSISGGLPSPKDVSESSPDTRSLQLPALWQKPTSTPTTCRPPRMTRSVRRRETPERWYRHPLGFCTFLGESGIRRTSEEDPPTAASYLCSSEKLFTSSHFKPPLHSTYTVVSPLSSKSGRHPLSGRGCGSHRQPYLLNRAAQVASWKLSNSLFWNCTFGMGYSYLLLRPPS